MASQLESYYDLHHDTKQANNIYSEANMNVNYGLNALYRNVSSSETKDATTQTLNSNLGFIVSENNLSKIIWRLKEKHVMGLIQKLKYFFFIFFKVSREEKSLGIMSQKFLMLFLTSEVN
jgi:hypothetical protein